MTARRQDEPFEQYKKRRKLERKMATIYRRGKNIELPKDIETRENAAKAEKDGVHQHIKELFEFAEKLGIKSELLDNEKEQYVENEKHFSIVQLRLIEKVLIDYIKNNLPKAPEDAAN